MTKSKLEHAKYLALLGFSVFPLAPNSKVPPAGLKWREVSSKDQAAVEKWWSENPDYNIGIDTGKSGLCVIDVDVKDGKEGEKSLDNLAMFRDFPATCTAVTATGGRHLIYQSYEKIGNTASALAKDIDTRGEGGYIVGVGSTIDGKEYSFAPDSLSAATTLPSWISEQLSAHKNRKQLSNRNDILANDNPADIERAKEWLEDHAGVAVEGRGGDHTTYAVAAKLREFGLSQDTALELMLDWNECCIPPWSIDELTKKIENAYKYAIQPQGAASVSADFDKVIAEPDYRSLAPYFIPPNEFEVSLRDWVVPEIALAKNVTVLTAPAGVGKSTFTMSLSLSAATGKDFLKLGVKKPIKVLLQNNEDDYAELTRRMVAIAKHHGVHTEDLLDNDARGSAATSRLMMQSGENRALRIAEKINGVIKPKDVDDLVNTLTHEGIRLLVVDPFAETHSANENDNGELGEVARMFRQVAQRANCAVILVHHDRKPDNANADGHIGNMHSARGASALAGVARIMYTFHTMTPKDCKQYGIAEEDRRYYARLDNAKANMSLSHGAPIWFKRVGERIGGTKDDPDSGESVGVLVRENLEVIIKDNLSADAKKILEFIEEYISESDDSQEITSVPRGIIRKKFVAYRTKDYPNASNEAHGEAMRKTLQKLQQEKKISYTKTTITIISNDTTPHNTPLCDQVGLSESPHEPTPPYKGCGDVGGVRGGANE